MYKMTFVDQNLLFRVNGWFVRAVTFNRLIRRTIIRLIDNENSPSVAVLTELHAGNNGAWWAGARARRRRAAFAGGGVRRDEEVQPLGPDGAAGRLESHFGVPHPRPEVSAGESIEAHTHGCELNEWGRWMQCVKRRENWGGEVWSCLYTQMRLLETAWLEIGHDQFHHLGGGVCGLARCCGCFSVYSTAQFHFQVLS